MKIVQLKYFPQYFEVLGIEASYLKDKYQIDEPWKHLWDMARTSWPEFLEWGIHCYVTKNFVTLAELNYWSVKDQIAFSGPKAVAEFSLKGFI